MQDEKFKIRFSVNSYWDSEAGWWTAHVQASQMATARCKSPKSNGIGLLFLDWIDHNTKRASQKTIISALSERAP